MCNEHQEIRLRHPTERNAGTHAKDCAGLVWRQNELLAQIFCLPSSPDLNPLDFSLWRHIDEKACKTRLSNTIQHKASVNLVWRSIRKGFVRVVWKSLRLRLERVIAAKDDHIIIGCYYIVMLQKLYKFTLNFVTVGVWSYKTKQEFCKARYTFSFVIYSYRPVFFLLDSNYFALSSVIAF